MIVLLLAVGVAAPAAATPVTVFFDGPSGWGVSAASAEALEVPFVYPEVVDSASGSLGVSQQLQGVYNYDDIVARLLNDSGNEATSHWTVANESGDALPEETYLFLATAVLFSSSNRGVLPRGRSAGSKRPSTAPASSASTAANSASKASQKASISSSPRSSRAQAP